MKYAAIITLMAVLTYGWIVLLHHITDSYELNPFVTGFGAMLIAGFGSWLDDEL